MEDEKNIDKNENEDNDIKEMKTFFKIYFISFIIGLLFIKELRNYRSIEDDDNIYYKDELIISDDEISKIEEKLAEETGKNINRDDNALVLNAVVENENLTSDEKQLIYECVDLLNENPYLNKSAAYNNLNKVDIEYDNKSNFVEGMAGVYKKPDDKIIIKSDTKNNDILKHETVHCIYATDCYNNLPLFFIEGMTELLTNEYFSDAPFIEETSYPYEILMVKMLCELIGPDDVLKVYSTGDIEYLEEKLKENKINNPKELLNSMQNISKTFQKRETVNIKDLNNILLELDSHYENIDTSSTKYQIYLYNIELLSTVINEDSIMEYEILLMEKGYYIKPYFSEKLKEKYSKSYCINLYDEEKIKVK